MQLLFSDLGLI